MWRGISSWGLILLATITLTGCGKRDPNLDSENGGIAELAEGWKDLKLISGGSEIHFDTMGHFKTSRNSCYQEEWGALDVRTWNDFVAQMNAIAKLPVLEKEICFPSPERSRYSFDGSATLVLPNDKNVRLLDYRGSETCAFVDRTQGERLTVTLNKLLPMTFREGCPGT
jgi:hypothetical protein